MDSFIAQAEATRIVATSGEMVIDADRFGLNGSGAGGLKKPNSKTDHGYQTNDNSRKIHVEWV